MSALYIVRHGIAVDALAPGVPDAERPLTQKGEKRMKQVARGLCRLELKIDQIVTSPAVRAVQTAQVLAEVLLLKEHLEVSNVLQVGASARAVARWLRGRSTERLMIVGHNPALSELISVLVLGVSRPVFCELKKGAIAALTPPAAPEELYQLDWVAPPRLLRRLESADDD
jgi:phosphohistidine phosphatase